MKGNTYRPMALGGGLLGLFAIALGLHTWGLSWFNSLVFDEVYYVSFALNYLNQQPFFDAHPPLGKYLIALGITLGQAPAAWLNWPIISVEQHRLSPLSYRWLNALVGSTLPLIMAVLAFHLSAIYSSHRRLVFGLLAGGLMLLEGLALVESRFALINIYWVWFGLLGQLCWVMAGTRTNQPPILAPGWRMVAGIALGAAINVKWNGAGFWLGLVLLETVTRWRVSPQATKTPLAWKSLAINLGFIPLITYSLLWIPHLWINQVSLVEIHRRLWTAHQTIGDALNPHPYCSTWYTWPLMLRPMSYFYQRATGAPPDSILAPLGAGHTVTYTVQGMGNPMLWWLATAAIISLAAGQLSRRWRTWFALKDGDNSNSTRAALGAVGHTQPMASLRPEFFTHRNPVVSFVLVNYGANWLPWMVVNRCTFLYHSLAMVGFSTLALAWLLSRWWLDHRWYYRILALVMGLAMLWGFWFWLPLFIGLPLSPDDLQHRWWLRSWI